uniref:Uncharacterized protein n=1 Tax=Gadus morhua TaxID=8049 RepID=A0A8C5C3M1_GADMO
VRNRSWSTSCCEESILSVRDHGWGLCVEPSPAGLSTALASVLILTIVVDIVGNVLVILSVFRNKKLRNAGQLESFLTLRQTLTTHQLEVIIDDW